MELPRIALVHWVDSAQYPYWNDNAETFPILECKTAGFLIEETDEKLVIAQSASMNKDAKPWADVIVIPKVAVKSLEIIKNANPITS